MGFEKPRPLYHLDQIAARPDATVLVVEGEKTADAATALLPHVVVTCWQGGAKAIQAADWTPLHGRKVVLWPDNDEPGIQAMSDITELLRAHVPVLKWVGRSSEFPVHWDIADATWTPDEALAYVRANMFNAPPKQPSQEAPALPEYHEPVEEFHYTPPPDDFGEDGAAPEFDFQPFKILGYLKEEGGTQYAFFSEMNHQVHLFKPSSMTSPNLMLLAPLEWWQTNFPKGKSKSSFNVEGAMNWLMRSGDAVGIYSPNNTRGRGAWMDNGKVVIHVGDRLVVDGQERKLGKLETRFVYEASNPLSFPTENPLSNKEANRLIEIMNLVNWERPINAHLLAGWCVIAPICGALRWRPHIWITGAAGTGKSWVFNSVVRRLLGKNVLAVQSETSEAGIRQSLGNDAIPIVFDEAEGEDKRARERMDAVLSLMRASSAEDGGVMIKGSAGGRAQMYRIRSCFAFASIGVQIQHQSDRGRVTILGLIKPHEKVRAERWDQLKKLHRDILTQEFVARLQARTISLMPVILDNADTFAEAVAYELGEQRTGDQLGALLAGAYSLYSSNRITLDAAIEWVRSKDWSEEKMLDVSRDEHALLSRLMDYIVKVDGPNVERTIGELILIASGYNHDENVSIHTAHQRLIRYGFKVEQDSFLISQSNSNLLKLVADTAWVKSVGRTLMRVEGAQQVTSARFGPGQISRAVKIPLKWLKE